jgi:hypothetical protein
MTNPTGDGVVDVKTCNSADTGPCGHGHHEEEKEPCIRSGKREEGCQGVYRACVHVQYIRVSLREGRREKKVKRQTHHSRHGNDNCVGYSMLEM